jgi:ubiquinone biosynthesis protein
MDIVRKSIGIGQTIRNVNRLKEIVLILGRHGFGEFISLGVIKAIPNFALPKAQRSIKQELKNRDDKDWKSFLGARLRVVFEELGPAFIKFGQLLSSREDIFDASFTKELKPLRDQVKPLEFSVVKKAIEDALGESIETVFESLDEEPLGTASIGVVHRAVLKSGEEVVVKLRRPQIEKVIQTDFSILGYLATQAEKISDDVKSLGLSKIVKEFSVSIQTELNFHIEALNCDRLKKNLDEHDGSEVFYIPKIYSDYTREDLIVMELIKGVPFSDLSALQPHIDEITPKLEQGVSLFLKSFLKDGFFHADLHGGNFFYMENGQIGLIDFGLMGSLSRKNRRNLVAIIYALVSYNYENLVYEFLDVAEFEKTPHVDELIRDVKDCLNSFVGLTVSQTNLSIVLNLIMQTLRQHQIYLPREWYIVFRALMTLDGVGKTIGFDYDILELLERDIEELVSDSFDRNEIMEEGIWATKDLLSLMRVVPRHFKWMIREISSRGYSFEVINKGYEKPLWALSSAIYFLGYSLISVTFIISGVLMLAEETKTYLDIPLMSWVFWSFGMLFLIRGTFFNAKKKG